GLDVELGEVLLDELARAPVAVARHDQVPAARQEREEQRGGRAHPGGGQRRSLRALELAQLALHGAPGRVAVAAVFVALGAAFLIGRERLGIGKPERGRLVDRSGHRVGGLVRPLAAVHGARRVARKVGALAHACSRPVFPALAGLVLSSAGAGPEAGSRVCKHRKSPGFSSRTAPPYAPARTESTGG